MSMHLKHPKKRGFLSWEELGCLARALGFQCDIFVTHLPEDITKKDGGISLKKLYHVLDFFKYLNAPLDRTSNIHTDEWNLHVLKKAVSLLDQRVFSFSEIQSIRMAYQVYESPDTKGLLIDEWVLLRALKMCGRTISPLKMMHRIKHMRNNFEEPDRIQLHEFMDLLLWCEMYEGIDVKPREMNMSRDERNMFHLEDFEEVLSHHDERLAARLNALYHKEEWRFTREKHTNKAMPKEIPPVDAEIRRKQVRHHQERYSHLRAEVSKSQRRVFAARAGYVRTRPVSAPDLHTYEPGVEWSESSWTSGHERPHTVYEITRHLYNHSPAKAEPPDIREEVPRPKVTEYTRPRTPCAVTSDDVTTSLHAREALEFEQKTIDQKYERILEEDQDYHLPGYRNRLANMPPKEPPPEPPPPPTPKTARPSEETLRRLSANKSQASTIAHSKTCDARLRGWFTTKARRGLHIIRTGPTYGNSPNGRLLSKMHHVTRTQGRGEDYAYRYTKKKDVDRAAAQVYNTSVLSAGASNATLATTTGTSDTMAPSDRLTAEYSQRSSGDHDTNLNTTTDSGDSSKALNTTKESNDSKGTSSEISDVQTEMQAKSDDAHDNEWERKPSGKAKLDKRRKGAATEPETFSSGVLSLKENKIEDRNKEKVIRIRKVGRIEVLEEISEKGEEDEDRQTVINTSTDGEIQPNSKRSRSSSMKYKTSKDFKQNVEHLDLGKHTSLVSDNSIPSLSSRSESISSVPYSREVSKLMKSGPEWLSEIITSTEEVKPPTVDNLKACRRLAKRLGGDISSELRYRLLCSTA